jgi:hypothetical protein
MTRTVVGRGLRIVSLVIVIPIAGACAHVKVRPLYRDHPVTQADPEDTLTRTQIESPGLRKGMFLINWVPDLLSNYIVALKPGNLWPIQYLLWPISGAYWGTRDAWHGYPFWEPTAVWD